MPKTSEKDAYFFSHDCNARNDPKILALRSVYGAEGYGVYFMLIEILREQPEYKLSVNKYIWNTLAMQMQMQAEKLQEIITDCCTEFTDGENGEPLLINDGKYLYSASLLRRMGRMEDVSRIRSAAARKRWENKPCKDFPGDGENGSEDAPAMQKQSKEMQRKEKKRKGKENISTPPTPPPGGDTAPEQTHKPEDKAPEDWGWGEELTDAFKAWLRYKTEKRQGYKPEGLRALVTETRHNVERYGEDRVAALIRKCMACNWQGIIWDRLDQNACKGGQSVGDRNRAWKYV